MYVEGEIYASKMFCLKDILINTRKILVHIHWDVLVVDPSESGKYIVVPRQLKYLKTLL